MTQPFGSVHSMLNNDVRLILFVADADQSAQIQGDLKEEEEERQNFKRQLSQQKGWV